MRTCYLNTVKQNKTFFLKFQFGFVPLILTGCVPFSKEFGSDARSRKSEAKGA